MINGIRYVHTLNLTTNAATRNIMFDLEYIKPSFSQSSRV